MREAIGGISIFQIVILFILVFTGIMCLTINHSKAFSVKDDIINIIQNSKNASSKRGSNYEMNENVSLEIANALADAGYRITDNCPDGYTGYDRNGAVVNNKRASYCIRIRNISEIYDNDAKSKCPNRKCVVANNDYPDMLYYDVIVFYQLDIPIINNIMKFEIYGSTKTVMG